MRKITLFIFLLISFFLLSEFPVDAARGIAVISDLSHQSGKLGAYRALIIGINDYKDPKIPDLETAVNDASAMAELLKGRYGFKVELLLNRKATRKGIYKALRNLASSTRPSDSVLIYYAGHGDLDRTYDDGWWIPVDAKGGDPLTYLDNVQVQKSMRSMKARHVLLISDSCYSGTLFGKARSLPPVIDDKYYLSLYNEKSRWGMTSGNKTPVADEGTGGHSVFAYQLLKELRKNEKPYISTQELYTRIAPIVSNNSEQTPLARPIRNTGDQGGEFVFVASMDTRKLELRDRKRRELEQIKTQMAGKQKLEAQRRELEREKSLMEEKQKLEAQRRELEREKSLMEEKQKLEAQRRELEHLKALEEKKKLEVERRRLKTEKKLLKEKEKYLASIPKDLTRPMVVLRRKSNMLSTIQEITDLLIEYNFFDSRLNKKGDFQNYFLDNGDNTVTDKATGLMWQKGGSSKKFDSNFGMRKYIRTLNGKQFAGFSDWRVPTLEELASLLEPQKMNENLFIDPVFTKASPLTSSDSIPSNKGGEDYFWAIDFSNGHITHLKPSRKQYLPHSLRKGVHFPNQCRFIYVKAVRRIN